MKNKLISLQSKFFKAISNPLRFNIIKIIKDEWKCQCEIIPILNKPQSTISGHLDILVKDGILESKQEGLKVFYKIKNPKTLKLIKLGEEIVVENLKELSSLVA